MPERERGTSSNYQLARRDFLLGSVGGVAGMANMRASAAEPPDKNAVNEAESTPRPLKVRLTINDKTQSVGIDPRTMLVDLLREQLQMFGTKKGCDHGACGACTVHVDGRRVLACLTLAATLEGKNVATIEGLADGDQLHPMQEAFLRCDAYQCGYCTPGQIMSAVSCISATPLALYAYVPQYMI